MIWVRLNGSVGAHTIVPHTPPTWETLADGGTGSISFAVAMSTKQQHPLFRPGVLVEVMVGHQPVAAGLMNEPDRTTWEIHAQGVAAKAYRLAALDGSLGATRDVGAAIANAQSWGWPAQNPSSVSGAANGDVSGGPQMLGNLLDDYAADFGKRWGVDGERRIYVLADPIAPTYMIEPGEAAFGVTDDKAASHLLGRYFDGSAYQTLMWPATGDVESHEIVDLTDRGILTISQAGAILGGKLALRNPGGMLWTNGVEVSRQWVTRQGVPAFLPAVRAGLKVRVSGIAGDFTSSAPWQDIVIGKTRYTAGEESIYLEPANKAVRTAAEAWAA